MEIQENIPLAPYTIYKIGGPARYFIECASPDDVRGAVDVSAEKKLPFFVLGAGSNMLVADRGFPGVAIRMMGGTVRCDGEYLIADAGVMMARAVAETASCGLSGYEWGIGVPGTIGGSVRGNAGCFAGEMKDVVKRIQVLDARSGVTRDVVVGECGFGYRDSFFKRNPYLIVLSATLRLVKDDAVAIQKRIREVTALRAARQDIGSKCAGCIFKNVSWPDAEQERAVLLERLPELERFSGTAHIPASFLIDKADLKGRRVGRVVVSAKHANYFVNEGGATADDVRRLIADVQNEVEQKYGIRIEEEIQCVGFD